MAFLCVVPASALYPDDTWSCLIRLVDCDWDDLAFLMSLEKIGVAFPSTESRELPRFIPGRLFWMKWPAPATFGLWSTAVAEHLVTHGYRQTKRSRGSSGSQAC